MENKHEKYEDANITSAKYDKLLADSIQLLNHLKMLDMPKDITEELYTTCLSSIKKLYVAKLLYGKSIIAVSGEQGAGKSTMMKNMYCLEDDILSVREGRGEKIPILVSEHENTYNEYILHELTYDVSNQKYIKSSRKLEKNDFTSTSESPTEGVLFLELVVPRRYFEADDTSFMLLPGFEKPTEYWQSIIDFSLACSNSCIMVYQHSMLAGERCIEVAKRVKSVLGDVKPVYAISFSETLNETEKEQIIENSLNAFGINAEEAERFVFISNQSDEKNMTWIHRLFDCCNNYITTMESARYRQYIYTMGIIQDELSVLCQKFRYHLRHLSPDEHDMDRHPLLRAFDDEKEKKRKNFKMRLYSALNEQKSQSIKHLNEQYVNNDKESILNRMGDFSSKARHFLFGPSPADVIKCEKKIHEAMLDGKESRIILAILDVLEEMSKDIKNTVEKDIVRNSNQDDYIVPLIDYFDNDKNIKSKEMQLIDDTICIFKDFNDPQQLATIQTKSMKQLAIAIHSLATYIYANQVNDLFKYNLNTLSASDMKESDLDMTSLKNAANNSKILFTGALAMFGIDYLPDQEMDIITDLASVFGISTQAMTYLFGAVSIALLTQSTIKNINRAELKQFQLFRSMISQNYNEAKDKCLTQYDEYIDSIRGRLIDYIRKTMGTGQKEVLYTNANILLSRVEDNLIEIQKDMSPDNIIPIILN